MPVTQATADQDENNTPVPLRERQRIALRAEIQQAALRLFAAQRFRQRHHRSDRRRGRHFAEYLLQARAEQGVPPARSDPAGPSADRRQFS